MSLLGFPCKADSETTLFCPSGLFYEDSREREMGAQGQRNRGGGETEPRVPGCAGGAVDGGSTLLRACWQSHPPEPWKENASPPAPVLWVECCPGSVNSLLWI